MPDNQPTTGMPGDGPVPLPRLDANHAALSPLSFLCRAADVYPELPAVVYGEQRLSWATVYRRCETAAARLRAIGVREGDVVSVIAPNIPALFEAHFFVPMAGATLNAINTRLEADTVAYILEHAEPRVVFVDRESCATAQKALSQLSSSPLVIAIDDPAVEGELIGSLRYEDWVDESAPTTDALPAIDHDWQWSLPQDEWQSISLNYTSGTTGRPKGVLYHHRGATLNALANIAGWSLPAHPVYLWTLPMFHCNGWCFPWTLAAHAGTSICTRRVDAETIFTSIANEGVTHFCGAPIVLNMIINADESIRRPLEHAVHVMTAAAPPPASVLQKIEQQGFVVTHVYGLTETYGPAVMCAWKPAWQNLPADERARLKSRQGVRYPVLDGLDVLDPDTLEPVPRDGETIGEVMFRGNIVMRGYFKDRQATDEAFRGGWFHSGDLAVMDPDGYLRILDRAKDIIISGGENISSIEIEDTLFAHPDVLHAGVAARPDEKWGETPCAFVERREGSTLDEAELIAWCRDRLAHFKCPTRVVFRELPKTSTGKIQKFRLREWAREENPGVAPR